MDKSNKSQRQTCDQDMSIVKSERVTLQIRPPSTLLHQKSPWMKYLGQRHKNLANGKTKQSYFCRERVYCSRVFGRIHYVHVSNVTYRSHIDLQCTSYVHDSTFWIINQGSDHPSFVGAAKYSTILDTKQGAV